MEVKIEKYKLIHNYVSRSGVLFSKKTKPKELYKELLALRSKVRLLSDIYGTKVIDNLMKQVETLPPDEIVLLKYYYGLDDGEHKTLEECGLMFGKNKEKIRQVISRTVRRLRHPSRRHKFLYEEFE